MFFDTQDLKDGEIYDAGKTPGYGGKAVLLKEKNPIVPAVSDNVPVRRKERFTPKLLIAGDGTKVLDFGQNIAGVVEIETPKDFDGTLLLQFAETQLCSVCFP